MKLHVHESFDRLRKALDIREALLVRQYELLLNQSNKISSIDAIDDIKFLRDHENEVMNSIRAYGRFNINHNVINKNDFFNNEDYISPQNDHEIMLKCLNTTNEEQIVVKKMLPKKGDQLMSNKKMLSKNQLNNENGAIAEGGRKTNFMKENADFINDSIINITLNESKALIDKTNEGCHGAGGRRMSYENILRADQQNGNNGVVVVEEDEKEDEIEGGRNENGPDLNNVSNLTINNYTGNISLKNISNLTINGCNRNHHTQAAYSAEISPTEPKLQQKPSTQQRHVQIYNLQQEICPPTEDIQCDFYNRLLTDTKLIKSPKVWHATSKTTTPQLILLSKDIDLKNSKFGVIDATTKQLFKSPPGGGNCSSNNMKIVQQWLKQIIYETETEPIQTVEILEHSEIDNN